MTDYFPLFLNLHNKSCLVVGGGKVATPKAEDLLRAGARITLVAPWISPQLQELVDAGRIQWLAREFREHDLDRRLLVVAATDDPQLHIRIHAMAEERSMLFNAVDEPASCNFIFAALVRSGPVQVAVSSAGTSPTLAGRLRDRIRETLLGPEVGRLASWLGSRRAVVKARGGNYATKKRFWRSVLDSPIPEWLRQNRKGRAQQYFDELLDQLPKPDHVT